MTIKLFKLFSGFRFIRILSRYEFFKKEHSGLCNNCSRGGTELDVSPMNECYDAIVGIIRLDYLTSILVVFEPSTLM